MRLHIAPLLFVALSLTATPPALAEPMVLAKQSVTEWKSVFAQVEARDRIPARARLGGTIVELSVMEGDAVVAGQTIAQIVDEKLAFQISALGAQKNTVQAQLDNALSELKRGEELLKQGVTTAQALDARRTQVDVLQGQIAALEAQADVISQQIREGDVLAPAAGRVLDVPVAKGGVAMPGEVIATIAAGGAYLRLSIPERHAPDLRQGDTIEIAGSSAGQGTAQAGTLSRIYPLIQNGRVLADVEIEGLPDTFVGSRVLVRVPIGQRDALLVPASALTTQGGLDFVSVEDKTGVSMRSIVPGQTHLIGDVVMTEVLSGLVAGDRVLLQAQTKAGAADE
jgi:RND family efflux transporter MFP subunit